MKYFSLYRMIQMMCSHYYVTSKYMYYTYVRILSRNILKRGRGEIKGKRGNPCFYEAWQSRGSGWHPPRKIFTFSVVGFRVKSLQVYTWIVCCLHTVDDVMLESEIYRCILGKQTWRGGGGGGEDSPSSPPPLDKTLYVYVLII